MIAAAGLAPGFGPPAAARIRPVAPRSPARRHPRASRVDRGAVELLLWVVLGGALTTTIGTGLGFWRGDSNGYARAEGKAATERADLQTKHRADMDKLRADAQAKVDAAAARDAARFDEIDTARRESQRALALEQARTRQLRGELDSVRARAADDRMRNAIAAAATGGVPAAQDSVEACRARADALGRGMEQALHAHRVCSLDLEDSAGAVRALERWGDAVEASERAVEVEP